MTRWLSVIGVGCDGPERLSAEARRLIDEAELLIGGERHLAMVPNGTARRMTWQTPLSATIEELKRWRGRRAVVLATGDPQWFGIGVTLSRVFAADEMRIMPGHSAFSLACSRLGWAVADIECLTLHGRSLATMARYVSPNAKLLLLSENGRTPAEVARLLAQLGYGPSRLIVLERMEHAEESRVEGVAADWKHAECHDLNTIAVECVAGPDAIVHSRVPGLPDEAFRHDGQLTKREVRAATLAKLAPLPGQMLWDVGAGCGSVAIEWLRSGWGLQAIAIERDSGRCAMIRNNAEALGTPELRLVEGAAPAALQELPAPDAIFIGGGLSTEGLVDACWSALRSGGRLVANAVTIEGEARLIALWERHGGSLTRLAISHVDPIGPYSAWRPAMPVTQFAAVKP